MNPGIPELMEVESSTKKELDDLCKKLDLSIKNYQGFSNNKTYLDLFGIIIPKSATDLTFSNVGKQLIPTKNIDEFKKLIKMQLKEYKKIK
jgi:hypothetical protein